jgi:hypothetical protein
MDRGNHRRSHQRRFTHFTRAGIALLFCIPGLVGCGGSPTLSAPSEVKSAGNTQPGNQVNPSRVIAFKDPTLTPMSGCPVAGGGRGNRRRRRTRVDTGSYFLCSIVSERGEVGAR